jgi:hypothetical protein
VDSHLTTDRHEPVVPLHVWLYQLVINFLWPPLNYYRLHWIYICFCSIFGESHRAS